MRTALVLSLLAGLVAAFVGCYHNVPDPYFPNDPTCPPGGPTCPQARLDGGARG